VARYYDLVELACVCWRQSQTAWTPEAARTLRRMAEEYLQEAAKLDDGKVPDIGLVCLKEARQHHARSGTPMGGFVYRCPNTGLRVQGWVVDERDNESYEAVTCTICARVHLVNPKTGKVLAERDGE
jgi:hypothetical protein